MTFRQAILDKLSLDHEYIDRFIKTIGKGPLARRRWHITENLVIVAYEKDTGIKFTNWGDGKVVQWLLDHKAILIKIFLILIPFFI